MIVRPKFDPETAKVAAGNFIFNSVKFAPGDDFSAKTAKVSARQLKQMYSARRIKDKHVAKVAPKAHKVPKLTEAQEYAKAKAEQLAINQVTVTNALSKTKVSILQASADKEAKEAKAAKAKLAKAKAAVKTKAKPKRVTRKVVKAK